MEEEVLKNILEEIDKGRWFPESRREKIALPTQRTKLVRDNVLRVDLERGPITNPQKALTIFAELFRDCTVEVAAIIALNVDKEYLGCSVVARGSFDRVHIDPMEVFGRLWSYNAAFFIIAHNHPSGKVDPSPDDLDTFKELRGIGIALNRPMKDFLIVGFDEEGQVQSYSFRDKDYEL